MEEENPLGISLSISPESDDVYLTSVHQTEERGPIISIIMHSYIPCCFVLIEERQFCKRCTCSGLIAIVLCPLSCLPNTVDINEEKSLMNPCPSNLIKSNEDASLYRNDWISKGHVYVCFSGLNYFIIRVPFCHVLSIKGLSST